MGTKRYVNRAKSGALALPAKLRRRPAAGGKPRSGAGGHTVVPRRSRHRAPVRGAALHGEAWFDAAVEALADRGWFRCAGFAPPAVADALAAEARALWAGGGFRPAGIGRGTDRHVEPAVRGDWLHWLDGSAPTAPQRQFLALVDAFRAHLNRELRLTLQESEVQYAVYPPGTRYRRHIDQFRRTQARLITVLLYLNPGWAPEYGGALRIYPDPQATEPAADVLPAHNTFVCFRSERIPHEVLPPTQHRYSLGGWLRVRSPIPRGG